MLQAGRCLPVSSDCTQLLSLCISWWVIKLWLFFYILHREIFLCYNISLLFLSEFLQNSLPSLPTIVKANSWNSDWLYFKHWFDNVKEITFAMHWWLKKIHIMTFDGIDLITCHHLNCSQFFSEVWILSWHPFCHFCLNLGPYFQMAWLKIALKHKCAAVFSFR